MYVAFTARGSSRPRRLNSPGEKEEERSSRKLKLSDSRSVKVCKSIGSGPSGPTRKSHPRGLPDFNDLTRLAQAENASGAKTMGCGASKRSQDVVPCWVVALHVCRRHKKNAHVLWCRLWLPIAVRLYSSDSSACPEMHPFI